MWGHRISWSTRTLGAAVNPGKDAARLGVTPRLAQDPSGLWVQQPPAGPPAGQAVRPQRPGPPVCGGTGQVRASQLLQGPLLHPGAGRTARAQKQEASLQNDSTALTPWEKADSWTCPAAAPPPLGGALSPCFQQPGGPWCPSAQSQSVASSNGERLPSGTEVSFPQALEASRDVQPQRGTWSSEMEKLP